MINCFKSIQNVGVYRDFVWDSTVVFETDNNNGVDKNYFFNKINVIYGQNYAGKTTLSRLLKALQTGSLSSKYENPSFEIELDDSTIINQDNLSAHSFDIRVFNQDFIVENLSFLIDESSEIKPFIVLGEHNNEIERQVIALQQILGKWNEDKELCTGLYAKKLEVQTRLASSRFLLRKLEENKDKVFMDKATRDENSIKNNHSYFSNNTINYNKSILERDIQNVDESSKLDKNSIDNLKMFIREDAKSIVQEVSNFSIDLESIHKRAKELLVKELSVSQSIKELDDNTELANWVRTGKYLHEQKDSESCLFCGNNIDNDFWDRLDRHFNQKSETLRDDLQSYHNYIDRETSRIIVRLPVSFDEKQLYVDYRLSIKPIIDKINNILKKSYEILNVIKEEFQNRLTNIMITIDLGDYCLNFLSELEEMFDELNNLIKESNKITNEIDSEKNKAKTKLFQNELIKFKNEINYDSLVHKISEAKEVIETIEKERKNVLASIALKENKIEQLESERNDEYQGAENINKILCNQLGLPHIKLSPIKHGDICHYRVIRDGKIAHHLSEGEKSLIAFCYFIAKMEEASADKLNRIIWIDDPISSLDSSHVFYIYSLIKDKIVNKKDEFKQFFVSTHNLEFLKLSKRFDKRPNFYLVNRGQPSSSIQRMPNYLLLYTSEFNYLFENIYRCATEDQSDNNFTLFFNFGNNCRKFIEVYLAFKCPDSLETDKERQKKLEVLFGDSLPVLFTERLNNEYSHLTGNFERGITPVYKEEVTKTANLVLDVIRREDSRQFQSLVDSLTMNKNIRLNNLG